MVVLTFILKMCACVLIFRSTSSAQSLCPSCSILIDYPWWYSSDIKWCQETNRGKLYWRHYLICCTIALAKEFTLLFSRSDLNYSRKNAWHSLHRQTGMLCSRQSNCCGHPSLTGLISVCRSRITGNDQNWKINQFI